MGMAVFKQPDGKYLVWDYHAAVAYDCNADEVKEYVVERATRDAELTAADLVRRADEGRPLSFETFPEKVRLAREAHADDDEKDADFEEWLARMETAIKETT